MPPFEQQKNIYEIIRSDPPAKIQKNISKTPIFEEKTPGHLS